MVDLKSLYDSNALFDNRYKLESRLGGGGFSEVWLAYDTKSFTEVALKVYVQAGNLDDDGLEMFRKEFSSVCNFNHSNILRPFSFETTNNHPYLVLPYCANGSSSKYLGKMTEDEMWHFIEDVASGLEYLHSYPGHPVIHQDIKPANILIDATGQYLITDFGISIGLHSTLSRKSEKEDNFGSGTIAYMAPERFDKTGSMPLMANDIWSLGATLYELATGDVPFGEFGGLTQTRVHKPQEINNDYSKHLKELIYSCLAENTWERPTAKVILKAVRNREFTDYNPAESKKKKIRFIAICLSVVLLDVISCCAWYWYNERKRLSIQAEIDKEALLSSDQADSIISCQQVLLQEQGTIENISEDSLLEAVSLYDLALKKTGCSDSVYDTIFAHKKRTIDKVVKPAYMYLKDKETQYQSVRAYNAAAEFQARRQKLDKIINNEVLYE